MGAFRMPEVGLGIGTEDFAGIGNEGSDVEEDWL